MLDSACLHALHALFGDRLTTHKGVCLAHGSDETFYAPQPPDAVIFPESTEEVAAAVKICARYATPIIPYGAGSALEGHFLAVRGGVCFDLGRMKRILRVSAEDLDCTVEAGVTRKQLNRQLRETGLMFPIDPGADATIGGMTATRASGTNAVRYGTMRENVISLKAVLADGAIVETARRARKSSAGYDLTRLLVGSEGTLGVITEITLRLHGVPEAIAAGVCSFKTLSGAVETVIQTIQTGLPVARIELLDEAQVRIINDYANFSYPVAPTLWFEFHGSQAGVTEQAETFAQLVREQQGDILQWSTLQEEREQLWQARHQAWSACHAAAPGKKGWATDVCVPISRLADCVLGAQREIAASPLQCSIIGHVGDGNFHVIMMVDPADTQEIAQAEQLNAAIVELAQQMDGTCTGEHGIGLGKIDKLVTELPQAVPVMALIKKALDPDNIMNPGKVLRL